MAAGTEFGAAYWTIGTELDTKAFKGLDDEIGGMGAAAGKSFSDKFNAGLKIASVAIVAGVAGAAKGLYEIGGTFDDVSDTIRVGTGATGQALADLEESAKNIGRTTPAAFENIGSTVADVNTRMGLTGKELDTVAKQYLEAGRILGTEVDINATSAAFGAFGIKGAEVSGAMDELYRVSQATGVGINELAASAQTTAPAMQNLGFSFEDSIAAVGAFDKAGLNGSAVMSSMSKGLVTLAKDGEEPIAAFKRVTGEIQSLVDNGENAAAINLASGIFGARGATQFVGALQNGQINMNSFQESIAATDDTILKAGEETADFAEQWLMFKNNLMVELEPIATRVFGGMGTAIGIVSEKSSALFAWMDKNQGAVTAIGIAIGVLAAGIVLTQGVLLAYSGVMAVIRAGTIAWTVAQWAFNAAMTANPIGLIIVAVAALIGLVVLIVKNWDTIGPFFSNLWAGVRSAFSGAVSFIGGLLKSFVAVLAGIGSGIAGVFTGIITGIGSLVSGIVSKLSGAGGTIKNVFMGIANVLKFAFMGLTSSIMSPMRSSIMLMNLMIRGLNKVRFSIPSWVPGLGGKGFALNIPQIPMLAQGGVVQARSGGTMAILGEAGRSEAVVDEGLLNKNLSHQNKMMMNLFGDKVADSSANNVTNNFEIKDSRTPEQTARAVNRLQRWDLAGAR